VCPRLNRSSKSTKGPRLAPDSTATQCGSEDPRDSQPGRAGRKIGGMSRQIRQLDKLAAANMRRPRSGMVAQPGGNPAPIKRPMQPNHGAKRQNERCVGTLPTRSTTIQRKSDGATLGASRPMPSLPSCATTWPMPGATMMPVSSRYFAFLDQYWTFLRSVLPTNYQLALFYDYFAHVDMYRIVEYHC